MTEMIMAGMVVIRSDHRGRPRQNQQGKGEMGSCYPGYRCDWLCRLVRPISSSHLTSVHFLLKRTCGAAIEQLMRQHQTLLANGDFPIAFRDAFLKSITPDNIRAGFKGTGLVPFDPTSGISGLDISYVTRTLTPEPNLRKPPR
jgi:hypothetical protein